MCFVAELREILDNAGHDEMYGVRLEAPSEGYVNVLTSIYHSLFPMH